MEGHAIFDKSRKYRYTLTRSWDKNRPGVTFIMLNPNNADALNNDPTIRRCISFAQSWEFGSLSVVNLFALRTPNPKDLLKRRSPVGKENDEYILEAVATSKTTVLAWGSHGCILERDRAVLELLANNNLLNATQMLFCLGLTKSNQPKHPLYLSSQTQRLPLSSTDLSSVLWRTA